MIVGTVVFVTTSYPRHHGDPSGHFVETEARARLAHGDDVTVLAPGHGDAPGGGPHVRWLPGGDAFGWPGALERIRQRPHRAVAAAVFIAAARRALARTDGVGEVIAHWIVPSAWPIAASSGARLEVVAHGSDVRLLERLPRRVREGVIGGLLDRGARFRFVSSELLVRLVRATTPALAARSRVAPSPVDVSAAPTRALARSRLGIDHGEQVVVVVSRAVPSKRTSVALRLAAEHAPDRVVLVGDGPLSAELRHEHPTVTHVGRLTRPDTLAWIAAADLLVSASRDEGAPTVVREARALGTRVLAVPSGDLRSWAEADPGITLIDA